MLKCAMRAMVLDSPGQALREIEIPQPRPGSGEVLVRVSTCAVCRTDCHIIAGQLPNPKLPLVLGHEIVGYVAEAGQVAKSFPPRRPRWHPLASWTCGKCRFCLSGREIYAITPVLRVIRLMAVMPSIRSRISGFVFPLPAVYSDLEAAPLLCAGLIGYRSLLKTGEAVQLGIFGFGAAAHLVTQVARTQGRNVFAFTRPGDARAQAFAKRLGAVWAGDSDTRPPVPLDAAIIFLLLVN